MLAELVARPHCISIWQLDTFKLSQDKNHNYTFFSELFSLVIFSMKIVSVLNFETVKDMFMRLRTNIKHHQRVCRE